MTRAAAAAVVFLVAVVGPAPGLARQRDSGGTATMGSLFLD